MHGAVMVKPGVLGLNYTKTKIVVFGRGNQVDTFSMHGQPIEVVPNFKYLGVMFDGSSRLQCSSDHAISQAKKALFGMRCLQKRWYQNVVDQFLDFGALIEPVLLYGSDCWGHSDLSKVE